MNEAIDLTRGLRPTDAKAPPGAARIATRAPTEHPGFARAVALVENGRLDEARAALEACRAEVGAQAELELAFLDIQQRAGSLSARGVALRIAHADGVSESLRARALHAVGLAEGKLRRSREALRSLEAAGAVYRAIGDRVASARVRDTVASIFAARGELDLALGQYAMSLFEKTRLGDRAGAAITIGNMGRLHLRAERPGAALECFELDLEIAREIGDRRGVCRMLCDIGRARAEMGEFRTAEIQLREALVAARSCGWDELAFAVQVELAEVCLKSDRAEEGLRACDAARSSIPDGADPYWHAVLLATRGKVLLDLQHADALRTLESAVQELSLADTPDLEIPTLLLLARALVERRYARGAEACLRRALQRARADGLSRHLPRIREAIKSLALVEGAAEERGAIEFPAGADAGAEIGGYVLLSELGKGGYGRTWKAVDVHRDRIVAVKQLALAGVYDPTARRRILASARTELEAAARLRHPGIARVHAIGETEGGSTYVVQDFVDGTTLREYMRRNACPTAALLAGVLADVAHALAALHDAGVVHRDVKPENILLVQSDERMRAVLIDFGIAQVPSRRGECTAEFLEGTLAYMSLEQAAGGTVDGAADIYALGVVAYEWLGGVRPVRFPAHLSAVADAVAILRKCKIANLTRARPDLPVELCSFVHRMLDRKARERPVAEQAATSWSGWGL